MEPADTLGGSTPFAKVDPSLRTVYGWASVITKAGEPVVDVQGDIIEPEELTKAAHAFITDARVGGIMHWQGPDKNPIPIGHVVESMVFTNDVQKALGISLGFEGWWMGMKVTDDAVWKMVQDGRLRAFSIGGSGKRVAAED